MQIIETIPALRIFDEQKVPEFYIDFLGFAVDWDTVLPTPFCFTCKFPKVFVICT